MRTARGIPKIAHAMRHPKIMLDGLNAPDADALCAMAPTMSTTTRIVSHHHSGIVQVIENADELDSLIAPKEVRNGQSRR